MTDKEKEYLSFVIGCLLHVSEGGRLDDSDKCYLYEILSELED